MEKTPFVTVYIAFADLTLNICITTVGKNPERWLVDHDTLVGMMSLFILLELIGCYFATVMSIRDNLYVLVCYQQLVLIQF